MQIATYTIKGGTGKSALSICLSLENDLGIISNDALFPYDHYIEDDNLLVVNPDQNFPHIPTDYKVVYDLGGYADGRVIEILKAVELVIVPMLPGDEQQEICRRSIANIAQFNKNILVVANCYTEKEFAELGDTFEGFPLLWFAKTKALDRIKEHKKPLSKIADTKFKRECSYKRPLEHINNLKNAIKGLI
jgi:MinD superfamily P-loop ATPase